MRIRHHHCSGRWDRPENLVLADVKTWVKEFDPDIFTATETGDYGRGRGYRVDGYTVVQGAPGSGTDECVIAFKPDKYKRIVTDVYKVTDKIYQRETGKPAAHFYALSVVLEDLTTGKRFIVSVMHLPSSVEDADGWDNGKRLVVYRACVKGWRKRVNYLGKKYKARTRLFVADWNINFKRVFARVFIQAQFPNLKLLWSAPYPNGGTHAGGRIIDATLATRNVRAVLGPRIGKKVKSSDHVPYEEVLEVN